MAYRILIVVDGWVSDAILLWCVRQSGRIKIVLIVGAVRIWGSRSKTPRYDPKKTRLFDVSARS